MALVILVRHGQTDENINGRISGQGPVPLNARGQEQARLAAETLAPLGITHIFSSPSTRISDKSCTGNIQEDWPLLRYKVVSLACRSAQQKSREAQVLLNILQKYGCSVFQRHGVLQRIAAGACAAQKRRRVPRAVFCER